MIEIKIIHGKETVDYASDFCKLYRLCFNDYIDENIYINRYAEPSPDNSYLCMAFDGDLLVANYSVIIKSVYCDGDMLTCAHSLNTMTHPDYEGKGLFSSTAKTMFGFLKEKGIDFIFSFPNYLANGIINKNLNWKNVYEIPTLTLSTETLPDISPEDEREIRISDNIPDGTEFLLKSESKIYLAKDGKYLKWRYFSRAGATPYRLFYISEYCWAIVKLYSDEKYNIVEFHCDTNKAAVALLNKIIIFSKEKGIKQLTAWSRANTQLHLIFERFGFRNKYPVTYFSVLCLKEQKTDVYDYRNWDIQMGDDNVY